MVFRNWTTAEKYGNAWVKENKQGGRAERGNAESSDLAEWRKQRSKLAENQAATICWAEYYRRGRCAEKELQRSAEELP